MPIGAVDGLQPGSAELGQVGREPVNVPVTGEGTVIETGQTTGLPESSVVPGPEGPMPVGAKPLEVDEQDGIEAAAQGVAEAAATTGSDDAVVEAGEVEGGEPVAVNIAADPKTEAHDAITGAGGEGGLTTLEGIIGNPSEKAKTPAEAPVISAFAEKGLDVPPARKVTSDTATASAPPVGATDFASPYPLPEKPAETTAAAPAGPQTFMNVSGLPGTPPPPTAEPQMPEAPMPPSVPAEPAPVAPEPQAPAEEPAPKLEEAVEAEDPTQLIDEFLEVDPASMIKESNGMADRTSFLLAAQYRDAQTHIRNMREHGWGDILLAPVVKDYRNALEAKTGETS